MSRFVFFGGKGGVGKTTCSVAHAREAAADGERVLLVSTDPAHSLGDALNFKLGPRPKTVPGTRGRLRALELDADAALTRWLKARVRVLEDIVERGTYFERSDVERFLELSFPGVDELIGLLELSRLADEEAPDLCVVDTAPTGHTLRLLQMPETLRRMAQVLDDMQEKHRLVTSALRGRHLDDSADALIDELDDAGRRLQELLGDPRRCAVRWVTLPEKLSVEEARDGVAALEADGLTVEGVLVNRVTPKPPGRCRFCEAKRRAEAEAIQEVKAAFGEERVEEIEEREGPGARRAPRVASQRLLREKPIRGSAPWISEFEPRLLLFGGKGGVGKTTCATAAALALAERHPDEEILLLSTDPAHSLGDALDLEVGDQETRITRNLRARELDADAAFRAQRSKYRDAVDALFDGLRGGSRFDATQDRAIVQDLIDLAPPGLDELFALLTVINTLFPSAPRPGDLRPPKPAPKKKRRLVVDTAPTGHALRLLELPEAASAWVRELLAVLLKYRQVIGLGEVAADLVELSRGLRLLREALRDPARTCFIPVTRAAELPRLETARLLASLRRLKVPVGPLILNAATPPDGCARCRRQATAEAKELTALRRLKGVPRTVIFAPAEAPPPRGVAAINRWSQSWKPMR
jgi:arsenite-transporting ATPase